MSWDIGVFFVQRLSKSVLIGLPKTDLRLSKRLSNENFLVENQALENYFRKIFCQFGIYSYFCIRFETVTRWFGKPNSGTQETQKSMLSRRTADFETPLNTSQESNNAGWERSNPLREPKGTNLETLVQSQFPRPSRKMATQIKVVKKGTRQGCVNTKV